MTQWYICNPSIIGGYSGDQQPERALVQALLEDKQFLAGRTVMSLPKLFWNMTYFYVLRANFGVVGAHLIFDRRLRS